MKLNHVVKFASPLFALCLLASIALAAFNFPQLTGRVTDQANIISAPAKASIETKLRNLEDKSGIQLVVATVSSLEGGDIESYANGLFRAWKLGMVKKNNGVLFLIAPNEHKMRIEVGYGLEGVLTDAVSSVIIRAAVAPRFKAGDFDGGIERGVDAIIDVFERHQRVDEARGAGVHVGCARPARARHPIHIVHVHHDLHVAKRAGGGGGPMIFLPPGGGFGGGGGGFGGLGGGGFDGGGFSGGGGSSGGGGASGDW